MWPCLCFPSFSCLQPSFKRTLCFMRSSPPYNQDDVTLCLRIVGLGYSHQDGLLLSLPWKWNIVVAVSCTLNHLFECTESHLCSVPSGAEITIFFIPLRGNRRESNLPYRVYTDKEINNAEIWVAPSLFVSTKLRRSSGPEFFWQSRAMRTKWDQ